MLISRYLSQSLHQISSSESLWTGQSPQRVEWPQQDITLNWTVQCTVRTYLNGNTMLPFAFTAPELPSSCGFPTEPNNVPVHQCYSSSWWLHHINPSIHPSISVNSSIWTRSETCFSAQQINFLRSVFVHTRNWNWVHTQHVPSLPRTSTPLFAPTYNEDDDTGHPQSMGESK